MMVNNQLIGQTGSLKGMGLNPADPRHVAYAQKHGYAPNPTGQGWVAHSGTGPVKVPPSNIPPPGQMAADIGHVMNTGAGRTALLGLGVGLPVATALSRRN